MLDVLLSIVMTLLAVTHPAPPAPAADPSLSRTAQVLAGRPDAAPFGDLDRDALLTHYATRAEQAWAAYERRIGAPLVAWADATLARTPGETLFYPFSGPDFVTVHRLYPDAARYVLVAIQPAGRVPDVAAMDAARLKTALKLFGAGLPSFARRGYFITDELNHEFVPTDGVEGIAGVLVLFAEREGFEVRRALPVRLADDGADLVPADPAGPWDSLRLELRRRADGAAVTLDYARVDLSDRGLKHDPAAQAWLATMTHHRVLLKAASHLLQTRHFKRLKALLLANPPTVLQDDSGLDYADLVKAFDVRLYGRLVAPNRSFQGRDYQSALVKAYRRQRGAPRLAFRFGYEKVAGTAIQYAVRREVAP
jgi:hypothetical protein